MWINKTITLDFDRHSNDEEIYESHSSGNHDFDFEIIVLFKSFIAF